MSFCKKLLIEKYGHALAQSRRLVDSDGCPYCNIQHPNLELFGVEEVNLDNIMISETAIW